MDGYIVPKKMKRLGDLFEKYRINLKAPQASVEKECVSVVKEVTGFTLTLECITYTVSTRTIFIQAPSLLKSELRFHYVKILTVLQERLGKEIAPKNII